MKKTQGTSRWRESRSIACAVLLLFSYASPAGADGDDDSPIRQGPSHSEGPRDPEDPLVIYSDQDVVPIEYSVTGSTHSVDLQFMDAGYMRRLNGTVLPYTKKTFAYPPVQFVGLFATVPQTNDSLMDVSGESKRIGDRSLTGGNATCRIWVLGKLVQERTVNGINKIARCGVTIRFTE